MIDIKDLVLRAIELNQFDCLLKGESPYQVPFGYGTPGDGPTNWLDLLTKGIYIAHSQFPSRKINEYLLKTLESICNDEVGAYSALYLMYIQLIKERDGVAPFKLDLKKLQRELKRVLQDLKPVFQVDSRWAGGSYSNGLWGDVMRIDQLMSEKFGVNILD